MIVVKFGGTSLADAARYRHAAELVAQDSSRTCVVVSAPGKRFSGDIKITDMLYHYADTGLASDLAAVRERFEEIVAELGLDLDLSADFARMEEPGCSREFMASRGEYLSGRIMAALLGRPFVDAADCICFDETGRLDLNLTEQSIFRCLRTLPGAVIPGFYGADPRGNIRTFSRGGSDITGALAAAAMDAQVYENWTDVDGILSTDPRLVPQAVPIRSITYAELRELAYHGASVLHEASVYPARRRGVPIHIRNTFRPELPGSRITASAGEPEQALTGIAGRKGYSTIQIESEDTNGMVGYVRRILSCLEARGIAFEHLATGLGSVCVVVPTDSLAGCREQLTDDITFAVHPDTIRIEDGIAMIAAVGRGMTGRPGTLGRVFSALSSDGISVRVVDAGSGEINIVFGVAEADYENAIRAIHREFFEKSVDSP